MQASVRALCSGIIDYAGMFPPSKLPLDEALPNYLRYRGEAEGWMLGRFICPAARLGELVAFQKDIVALPTPLTVSALGRGGATTQDFLAGVRADLDDIARFHAQFGGKAVVELYETRLWAGLFERSQEKQLFALLGATAFLVESHGPDVLTPFYEPPSAGRDVVQTAIDALAADRTAADAAKRRRCRPAGLKLRCGAAEPAAFPKTGELAFALTRARVRSIPLKFTAGLHHPVRHYDETIGIMTHGFLNVFAAGVLGFAYSLKESSIQNILEGAEATAFRFDDSSMRWQGVTATCAHIETSRQRLVTSFGSCSFDEPRDELRALGLI